MLILAALAVAVGVGAAPALAAGGSASGGAAPSGSSPYPTCYTTLVNGTPTCLGAHVVYDPVDGYLVDYMLCLGGPTLFESCTWTYANGSWTNITATDGPNPPGFLDPGFVWDAADGYALLFGELSYPLGHRGLDAWSFRGGVWTNLTVPTPESAIWFATEAAYDSTLGEVVALWAPGPYYLGTAGVTSWAYRAGRWTNLTGLAAPPKLGQSLLIDDPAVAGLLAYGGFGVSGAWQPATWEFANGTWTNLTSAATPPADVVGSALAYDPFTGQVMLVGGQIESCASGVCPVLAFMWLFGGDAWVNVTGSVAGPLPIEADGILVANPPSGQMIEGFGTASVGGTALANVDTPQSHLYLYANGAWSSVAASSAAGPAPPTVLWIAVGAGVAVAAVAAWAGLRRR